MEEYVMWTSPHIGVPQLYRKSPLHSEEVQRNKEENLPRKKRKHSKVLKVRVPVNDDCAPPKTRVRRWSVSAMRLRTLETRMKISLKQVERGLKQFYFYLEDLSKGVEAFPIPVLNDIDSTVLTGDEFIYTKIRVLVPTAQIAIHDSSTTSNVCRCKDTSCCMSSECPHISKENLEFQHALLTEEKGNYDAGKRLRWIVELQQPVHVNLADIFSHITIYECNNACLCSARGSNCSNRVVQKGMKHRVMVVRTPKRGWGVLAMKKIKKGSFVCEYTGEFITDHEAAKRSNDGKGTYIFEVANGNPLGDEQGPVRKTAKWSVDAMTYGNVARFFNHSCSPNLVAVRVCTDSSSEEFHHIALFATSDVDEGEELTFDYLREVHTGSLERCLCGSEKCRKWI